MTDQFTHEQLLNLTPDLARKIASGDTETIIWALLQLSALARERAEAADDAEDPATPSAMIPPYKKPATRKRKAKPGRKAGHKGERRARPLTIDRNEEHVLERCPDCGGPVSPPGPKPRTRIVEDIEQARPVVTQHTIHSHYCPCCKKSVEPVVSQALPKSTIGNRTVALTSWLHYGLGNTVSQVASVLNSVFRFPISEGGLIQMWRRLAEALEPWYNEIAAEARESAVLHADETGWRVNGKTHWLWCFTHKTLTYYIIDESRSSSVLKEFFGEVFTGTLVSDFFGAYNRLLAERRQVCLAHLLRELKKVSKDDHSDEWLVFAETLKRIVRDALRLAMRPDRVAATGSGQEVPDYAAKRARIHKRLDRLRDGIYENPNAARIVKRLNKYREALFSFLDDPGVPPDNNRAEREIRPAVIARKNSFHNMSEQGARTQAILMSVYRTLKLRGHDPIETIADALGVSIAGARLPPLPAVSVPNPTKTPTESPPAANPANLPKPRDE